MTHNAKSVIAKGFNEDPISKLWMMINSSPILACKLNEYNKLDEITLVQVLGPTKISLDIQQFNLHEKQFVKCLTTHLDVFVLMFNYNVFSLSTFPYHDVILYWKEEKVKY
jgi:hypothetical protein